MKLYYLPGACSLASHIALREAGIAFDLDKIDHASKKTAGGENYLTINPKGYVPALTLDSGEVLTEGAAILQFIADQHPEAGLAPANGTLARFRLNENLTFVSSELHKSFGPLFNPASSDGEKEAARARIGQKLDQIERQLSDGRSYLQGETFSVADAYLFVVTNWTGMFGMALDAWPKLQAFMARVAARDTVQQALKAEGLAA